ncbi:MAG: DUF2333 family protein [Sphingomonadales bacterium]|jgi:hypothetical protein
MSWLKEKFALLLNALKAVVLFIARWFDGRRLAFALVGVLIFAFAYYLIGMLVVHKISDDVAFTAPAADRPLGGSETVALVTAVLDREVNRNGWIANDPWFFPTALMDNMPNYQEGLRGTLALFAVELRDQIGRNRGSSAADPDLETAVGKINYPGNVWIVANVVVPRQPSESAYREALTALRAYNRRVGAGEAVFERRADNLLATLDRLALDLGAASAALDSHIGTHSDDWVDLQSDDIFYNVKGRAYAVYIIMKGLEADFAPIIKDRELNAVWVEAKKSLEQLLDLSPWIVTNGERDGMILNNHLAVEGFYLMRTRTQIRELTNILLK